ncbi:YihY/virulence factor BrkB family protein [Streptomyces albus subsp. chlorinus]|uniref:YihY/virulence factor BrkB family protein n=1 Tax=Streptomyces albus TaxID=1888 RepID=UPI00156D85BC|nr:YihY/virulence factor BrkB family protein [Streptomyces albus]NSC24687.1 YihY/virulence factor BrkB family protein [Streptomyces albus subsp. chlorinus]
MGTGTGDGGGKGAGAGLRLDAFQKRHPWAGLPLAVAYKVFDDQALYLVALLTYYTFLSIFPMLLLFVSGLGAFLEDNPDLQRRLLNSVLSEFPVLGDQIRGRIHPFRSNGIALAIGVVGSLYGSLGVAQAAQYSLNKLWAVPRRMRHDPFRSRLKGMLFLMTVAGGLTVTLLLSLAASESQTFGADLGAGIRAAITLVAVAVNAGLLLATYSFLTHHQVALRHLWAESVAAACAWQALQWGGGYYATKVLRGASATYGMFGIVLGLLGWIYLGALIFVLAAEVSVVRAHRLWPRSLLTPFTDRVWLTWADRKAYASYATTETFKSFQSVTVEFDQRPPPGAPPSGGRPGDGTKKDAPGSGTAGPDAPEEEPP